MAVNVSKTKFIIFRTRGKKIDVNGLKIVFNSNEPNCVPDPAKIIPLEQIANDKPTKYYKLLGVLLDEYLSFEYHIKLVCNKIAKSL